MGRSWPREATKAVLFLFVARGGRKSREFGMNNLAFPTKSQEMLIQLAGPREKAPQRSVERLLLMPDLSQAAGHC